MLPQKHRVKTEEFPNILKNGRRLMSQNLSVTYIPNTTYFKASVVISKKISKKATDRNYQKRLVRECIRKTFFPFDEPSKTCIFFIKQKISSVPFTELLDEIEQLSKKLK